MAVSDKTTGEKIKQARLNSHMTQKQLAEKCGMADSAIRKYESGKVIPKVETVQKIAKALGERWNWFYALTAEDGGIDIRSERLKKEGTYEERLSAACEWLEIIESDAERKTKRIWRADEENQRIKKHLEEVATEYDVKPCDLERVYPFIDDSLQQQVKRIENMLNNGPLNLMAVEKICNALEQMNPRAQNLAAERVQELARIPEYQWQKENDVE